MTLLSFEDLAIERGDRTLLSGLRAAVAEGQVLHVHGPNGAGKTSLLEVLAGLRRATAGTLSAPEPGECHWLGHRNGLSGALSPVENLRFWCRLNDADVGGIAAALAQLGLESAAGQPCRELSAGQNRRTALARLLLAPRRLWLLDEPLAALDRAGIDRFFATLRAQLSRGGAVVLTSHQALPALPGLRTLELA